MSVRIKRNVTLSRRVAVLDCGTATSFGKYRELVSGRMEAAQSEAFNITRIR